MTLRIGANLNRQFHRHCVAMAALALSACAQVEEPAAYGGFRLVRSEFSALENWNESDKSAALTAFLGSCAAIAARPADEAFGGAGYGGSVADWRQTCTAASSVTTGDASAAARFFENAFVPYRVLEGANAEGLFTGYFEPELRGSRMRGGVYQTPLHGVPADLVSVDLGLFREGLAGQRISGRVEGSRLVPYASRAEIARGALGGAEPVLYVDDPVDAFFLQIQGSGRVMLDDGTSLRAAYAGQNGHPYTAIGAVLVRRGEMTLEQVSMQSIRAWLGDHPNEAQALMDENASYVFFTLQPLDDPALGARGTQGVPLTAAASLAVDRTIHPLGVPLWLETTIPPARAGEDPMPFHRLLIAQDTGGAINGAIRGDIYWGVGDEAGAIAGRMRGLGTMTVLIPRALAERFGDFFPSPEPSS